MCIRDSDDIAWGKVNRPMEKEKFDAIFAKVTAYLQNKEVYVFDGFAGADPKYTKSFRIVNELASQNLFIHQLLRRPTPEQLASFTADYTIVAAPGFKCVPEIDGTHSEAAILVDYEAHLVVICGTRYAGEIKKSVFSVMNLSLIHIWSRDLREEQGGTVMETYGLEQLGIVNAAAVYRNLAPAQLTEHALRRGEGTLSATGALVVKTGKYTGRSANDKFLSLIHIFFS